MISISKIAEPTPGTSIEYPPGKMTTVSGRWNRFRAPHQLKRCKALADFIDSWCPRL